MISVAMTLVDNKRTPDFIPPLAVLAVALCIASDPAYLQIAKTVVTDDIQHKNNGGYMGS